jgi:glycosyltransferase involved in cell wall biosynthesis
MLGQHLRLKGVTVEIYTGKDWRLRSALKNSRELTRMGLDILHMQYPATGYGWTLGPQFMAIANAMVLTLHEASQSHMLRRLSLYPFSLRAQQVIFTNEFEQAYVQHFAPWIKNRSHLVPIGNNVPLIPKPIPRTVDKVTYFGLIRPEKGLEEVMELARLLNATSQRKKVRIIGRLMPGHETYYERLRAEGTQYGVEWLIGLNGEPLSRAIASSDIAYVPFPDGASERRSSLIALLANGSAVITTKGPHTPMLMRDAILLAASPLDAHTHVLDLEQNTGKKLLIQQHALNYAAKFEWDNIAARHISIYEKILEQGRVPERKSRKT